MKPRTLYLYADHSAHGWMLSAIARKLNVSMAVILSSIVFTSLHYNPGQHTLAMAGTLAFAFFACGWALSAGNLWGVMGRRRAR